MTQRLERAIPESMATKLFGLFFIIAFISYGTGSVMVESLTTAPDFLADLYANRSTLVTAGVLMAVVHTFVNIALPVLMLPILKPYNQNLTYGYFGLAITATSVLAVGVILLLMLIPLGEAYVVSAPEMDTHYQTLAGLLRAGSTVSYHLGMTLWALGGLMFCGVLYQSRLLPGFMPIWGGFGYVVLAAGSVSELFTHSDLVEIISVIPGGLFEITLSIWLIIRGFNRAAPNAVSHPKSP